MASSKNASERRAPAAFCGVDLTRCLDAACLAIFVLLLSCCFLFMFGELLRMIDRTPMFKEPYVKNALNRLLPFRNGFDFNLTHALLFSICCLLLAFRADFPGEHSSADESKDSKTK
ncbi:putative integral membrane protein [Babesia bovis T2Bo]|uniref:Membrane protein, putative n=1 Tax=Babesia bovis TaxID=5865 RepID=A7AMQ2_BABBO|nr:putative integral membrane protein [Babesia bovis T2Bo]EDO07836.1 putative integral membrane protein [Babesia bovis T2Bo]|eukprot:XP_001611404.1 membrane protein [Babesia bovis T2Bo]